MQHLNLVWTYSALCKCLLEHLASLKFGVKCPPALLVLVEFGPLAERPLAIGLHDMLLLALEHVPLR